MSGIGSEGSTSMTAGDAGRLSCGLCGQDVVAVGVLEAEVRWARGQEAFYRRRGEPGDADWARQMAARAEAIGGTLRRLGAAR
jgi:hypothetical protein